MMNAARASACRDTPLWDSHPDRPLPRWLVCAPGRRPASGRRSRRLAMAAGGSTILPGWRGRARWRVRPSRRAGAVGRQSGAMGSAKQRWRPDRRLEIARDDRVRRRTSAVSRIDEVSQSRRRSRAGPPPRSRGGAAPPAGRRQREQRSASAVSRRPRTRMPRPELIRRSRPSSGRARSSPSARERAGSSTSTSSLVPGAERRRSATL
jgi:hypothetical protein